MNRFVNLLTVVGFLFLAAPGNMFAELFSYSGGGSATNLVTFDADSFSLLSGTLINSLSSGQDLAFDESGRLYGIEGSELFEYDPVSRAVLNTAAPFGALSGLAVRNGVIYAYSGGGSAANLVTFDANSFSLLSGTLINSLSSGQDLAFDEAGRLFGIDGGELFEYDPVSRAVLNTADPAGGLNGLAIIVPEPASSVLIAIGAVWTFVGWRRPRKNSRTKV